MALIYENTFKIHLLNPRNDYPCLIVTLFLILADNSD